jgi:hypothetical protein
MANKRNRVRNLKDLEKYDVSLPKEEKISTKHVIGIILGMAALSLIVMCSVCIGFTNKYTSWLKTSATLTADSVYDSSTSTYTTTLVYYYNTEEYTITYTSKNSLGSDNDTKQIYINPDVHTDILLEGTGDYILYNYLRLPSLVVLSSTLGLIVGAGAYFGHINYQAYKEKKRVDTIASELDKDK